MNKLGTSFIVGSALTFFAAFAAAEDAPAVLPEAAMVRVQSVEVIASPGGPVVVLKVRNKSIPVFVESLVAHSIQAALAGQAPPRPLSHDLMHTILESLDAKMSQAVITLKDGTFYGAVTILVGGKPKVFDARSSDAIALAIRFKAPILLDQALIDSIGVEAPKAAPVNEV
jgi:bifunctional DNase/RNase